MIQHLTEENQKKDETIRDHIAILQLRDKEIEEFKLNKKKNASQIL